MVKLVVVICTSLRLIIRCDQLQYVVWTALELEGLGASLQHHADYLTSIRSSITDQFSLPSSWKARPLADPSRS